MTQFRCEATDPDGDTYLWLVGKWRGFEGATVTQQFWIDWRAPKFAGNFTITVNVSDGKGGTAMKIYDYVRSHNHPPVISSITFSPPALKRSETGTITVTATDPDGDTLTYTWLTNTGKLPVPGISGHG